MRNCTLKVFDIWLEFLCYLIVQSFFGGVEGILTFHLAVRSGDEFNWPSVVLACSWEREMIEREGWRGRRSLYLPSLRDDSGGPSELWDLLAASKYCQSGLLQNASAGDGFENRSSITDGTWYSSMSTLEGFCPGNLKKPVISDLLKSPLPSRMTRLTYRPHLFLTDLQLRTVYQLLNNVQGRTVTFTSFGNDRDQH